MTESDLKLYLAMLEKKGRIYRAERVINPGSTNAEQNLKTLDQMAVKAMAKCHSQLTNRI